MNKLIRFTGQALMLATVLYLALAHQWYGIEKAAPIDGFCPFGGVVSFLKLVSTGEFVQRIYWGSIILMVITVAMTMIFGRAFCGFICPLGTLQEWIRGIGRRMGFRKDRELPTNLDKHLRYVKYATLILIMYLTYTTGELIFRNYDPYVSLMHFGEEFEEKMFGYSILALVLAAALVYKNFWCRYLCPLGGFYAIISRLKMFGIKRDAGSCIDCGKCNKACPHGIEVQHAKVVDSVDCVSCMRCVESCPEDCLTASVGKNRIKSQSQLATIVLGLFILLIGVTIAMGWWKAAPASNLIMADGSIDVANIRGSNTLEYLIKTTGVPLEVFQKELGIPEGVDEHMKLKMIGEKYGLKNSEGEPLEVEDFRKVVAEHVSSED
ncbi:4Fe-4S binding protein [Candidatus Altiarchaeota archaeon]